MEAPGARVSPRRVALILLLLLVVVLAGCNTASSSAARPTVSPTQTRDPSQALYVVEGANNSTTPWYVVALAKESGKTLWRYNLGNIERFDPLQIGSTVYVATNLTAGSQSSTLRALDAATGKVRWSHTTPGAIGAPPTVSVDGSLLFVTSGLIGANSDGLIEALRPADGSVAWHASVNGTPSGATAEGSGVFLIAGAMVLAFNLQTGAALWSYDAGYPIALGDRQDEKAPLVDGGRMLIEPIARGPDGTAQMPLIALDVTTGKVEWSSPTVGIESWPALDSGFVYVESTSQTNSASLVYGIDVSNGESNWIYESPEPSITNVPAADNLHVYITVGGNGTETVDAVVALNEATGEQSWSQSLKRAQVNISAPAMLYDDDMVGTLDTGSNCFAAFMQRDGSKQWCKALPDLDLVHATVQDGIIYTGEKTAAHPAGEFAAIRFSDGAVLWTAS